MINALKYAGIILSITFLIVIIGCIGCPKKAIKPVEPIPPPPEPTPVEPTPVIPELKLQNIYFDFDKYDIRTGDAEILKANAASLKDNPSVNVTIEGHCDPIGTAEYNMALGWRRATSTQDYLIKLGIDKARLGTISYGEERLVTEIQNEYWKDRRCEFVTK